MKKGRQYNTELIGWTIGSLVSLIMIVGALLHKLPLEITEVLGFVSGAATVWLVVKQNIWNWPVAIINGIFFIVLFGRAHLFADMSLQVVYIIFSLYGWYWWLRGGENKTKLRVSRLGLKEGLLLVGIATIFIIAMTNYLARINDVAPFLDALTTVMSLVAQYMMTRKYIENWLMWVAVDVIYVYLYAAKHLPLTAALYLLFLGMGIVGLRQWRVAAGAARHKERLTLTLEAVHD